MREAEIKQLAKIEANTENIFRIVSQMQIDRKEHLDKCHKQVREFEKSIGINTGFRKITCALVGSGTFLSFIILAIMKVIK